MSEATINEIRALICRSMADIGGACERLREMEDCPSAEVVTDLRGDISNWLSQAGDALNEAALMAEAGEVAP